MNAKELAALGAMIRESIEQHVTIACSALSEEFTKQIEDVTAKVDSLSKSIPSGYDDTELRKQLEELAKSIPEAYDDTSLRKSMTEQIEAVEGRLKAAMPATPRDGIDGRDALQLEILPDIDETKSYPRGTYAKHAGGLWRSFEQTSGMRGWECIVDGVAAVCPSIEGKRFKMTVRSSSGWERYADQFVPLQIYKGVFAQGEQYEQGDTTTWAGSLWHCNKTGTEAKPGDGSNDWTLAVKKGRDGREVVKTERKQQPVQINNGGNNDSI